LISDGQQLLAASGFSELAGIQKEKAMESLTPQMALIEAEEETSRSFWWILALVTLIIAGLMVVPVFLARRKKVAPFPPELHVSSSLNETPVSAPAGLFFDKTHTWAFMEKDGLVKMGIDDFIQHITGPLTRIIAKSPGEKIRKGEIAVTLIRDGKQLNLYAPVTGTIRHINKNLESNSSVVNSSPFAEGWIYMIEPRNWLKEIQYMLMGAQYRDWLKEELVRLKDFFADSSQKHSLVYSHVVLQDGGEIADHVLADMGPDVWEEFQTEFIDSTR
jgi:glycine cleavage system H lipoate-binding protein